MPYPLLFAALLPAVAHGQELRARTSLPAQGFVPRNTAFTIEFDRAPDPTVERVVVFIGSTDVTALFDEAADRLTYRPGLLPLPSGEHEVVVYRVAGGAWTEVARAALRVPGRLGIEEAAFTPRLDAGVKARLDAAYDPLESRPASRATYRDYEARLGIETELVRQGVRAATRANVFATNESTATLRFGERGADAPRIDLASYVVQWDRQPLQLAAGHVSAGNQRHLINNFGSRGITLGVAPGGRVRANLAAQHGSNLVGWDDLLGIGSPDHRLTSASVSIDARSRPDALRVDIAALHGAVLPRSGVNRAGVTDSERSRGLAVRAAGDAWRRRLRFEAGLTRSRFDSPPDPLLSRDTLLVEVRPETRDARYADVSLDALRGVRLGRGRTAGLRIAAGHERVDPLFRSVGAFARADFVQNRIELRGDVAHIAIGGTHQRSENNLDALPSVLKTRTERTSIDMALPVARVFGIRSARRAPDLRARLDRTHQRGVALPAAGGFEPSHVPDQVSTTRTLGADWRAGRLGLRYQFSLTDQDNRQPGREQADFRTLAHTAAATLQIRRNVSLSADLSGSDAANLERDETDRVRRIGIAAGWQPWRESALDLRVAGTRVANDGVGSTREDVSWSAQWGSPLPALRRFGARALVRYAHTAHSLSDPRLEAEQRRSSGFLDTGVTLRFF